MTPELTVFKNKIDFLKKYSGRIYYYEALGNKLMSQGGVDGLVMNGQNKWIFDTDVFEGMIFRFVYDRNIYQFIELELIGDIPDDLVEVEIRDPLGNITTEIGKRINISNYEHTEIDLTIYLQNDEPRIPYEVEGIKVRGIY